MKSKFESRDGFTMIECVVSATLLVTVISLVTTLTYRLDLVWRDTSRQRAAMNELSNQLEYLTRLSPSELTTATESLQPSEIAMQMLPKPTLVGELIDENGGQRLIVKLNWQRTHGDQPAELCVWLPPTVEVKSAGIE